ncbi:MAG: PIG-L family deacetylase [Dehalococcoidia bacterium]|nr:PIG-L family deacetylase [Dehalococcoidia bacterium]
MGQLRMLASFAHPDDEAFPVGGTLATYAARGVDVRLICATLGEEGEIRQPGSATQETLADVRHRELCCSCEALGIQEPIVLGYRDSGMAGTDANHNPKAFINADADEVVERLVDEMRRFRPQVVLTFGSDGLYGHPDHVAISNHTTAAFEVAGNPNHFKHQIDAGLAPHTPMRLFYSVRPKGFRMEMALKLQRAGIDTPLPDATRQNDGVDPDQVHVEMDVSDSIDRKVNCLLCHRTQMSPERPYHKLPGDVVTDLIGREHFIRGYPPVSSNQRIPPDFFYGIPVSD